MHTTPLTLEPPSEPQQVRSKRRYNLILKTASRLFEERGVVRVTTNDIAATANISVGSLYRYFPDKNAVILALVAQYTDKVKALLDKIEHDPHLTELSWQEIIYQLLHQWSELMEKDKANTVIRYYRNNPAFSKLVHTQRQDFWQRFIAIIHAKQSFSYPEKQMHMIGATCIVTLAATLEAAQDMRRHKDIAKKSELLRECAIMLGGYIESLAQ